MWRPGDWRLLGVDIMDITANLETERGIEPSVGLQPANCGHQRPPAATISGNGMNNHHH